MLVPSSSMSDVLMKRTFGTHMYTRRMLGENEDICWNNVTTNQEMLHCQ